MREGETSSTVVRRKEETNQPETVGQIDTLLSRVKLLRSAAYPLSLLQPPQQRSPSFHLTSSLLRSALAFLGFSCILIQEGSSENKADTSSIYTTLSVILTFFFPIRIRYIAAA